MKKSLNTDELGVLVHLYESGGELSDAAIVDKTALNKLLHIGFARHSNGSVTITTEGRHFYQAKLAAAIVLKRTLGY